MRDKRHIQTMCYNLKVGERVEIAKRQFTEAFPCGWPSMYQTHEQAFLSSMMGSAWGRWKVGYNPSSDSVTISHHEESDKRYHVEPDREHLFKQLPDGTWESRT